MTADTPTPQTAEPRAAVRRFVLVAIVLPLLTVAAGLGVLISVAEALPDPIAVHWGASGHPDGFGPLWLVAFVLLAVVAGTSLLMALTTLPALRRGGIGSSPRLLGAVSWGLAVFLTVLVTVATTAQAGLADAADAATIWMPLLAGVLAGAAAGAVGFAIQPRMVYVPTRLGDAAPLEVADDEQVVWLQRTVMARGGIVILLAATGLMVVIAVIAWFSGMDLAGQAVMLGVTVLLVLLVAMNLVFHVRVDEAGLAVTSGLGWPRMRVPLAEVAEAAVVHVDPMAEFGGWGLRWAPSGRFGVVMRAGEGIEVRRRSGKTFTVTVDDAAAGASVLTALAARAARRSDRGAA
ncbi:DUF1648 domain-containing protein [Microbacterium sp. TNHR37B]|uniref:DUF1648 domain-containing protein n=1 Tax=Microbacterium sp. TNHR37B TaxID=1775956 RepID=UPI0007B2A6EC|nr:DUF1648 domain-containing protein [Microbacterium sp. TNHR37B]KZE91374.1 hypothetical protein AVP41_00915 [Microbacterium sp. TNHR37B]